MEDEGWDEEDDTGPLTPATPADQLQTECTCLTLDKIGMLMALLRLLKQYNDDSVAASSASLRQYMPMLCGNSDSLMLICHRGGIDRQSLHASRRARELFVRVQLQCVSHERRPQAFFTSGGVWLRPGGVLQSQVRLSFASCRFSARNVLANMAKGTLRRRSSTAVTRAQQQAERGEMWPVCSKRTLYTVRAGIRPPALSWLHVIACHVIAAVDDVGAKFSQVFEAMTQDAIDEMVEQAFAQADANKDGKISASEFANWV
jgi:hypothetical protein